MPDDVPTLHRLAELVDLAERRPGLSANPLDPEPWWTRPTREWPARQLCNDAHLQREDGERHGWVLAGTVVGRGPDNEPRRVYEERFDAGRGRSASPTRSPRHGEQPIP